jgi:hypothetical protein
MRIGGRRSGAEGAFGPGEGDFRQTALDLSRYVSPQKKVGRGEPGRLGK